VIVLDGIYYALALAGAGGVTGEKELEPLVDETVAALGKLFGN